MQEAVDFWHRFPDGFAWQPPAGVGMEETIAVMAYHTMEPEPDSALAINFALEDVAAGETTDGTWSILYDDLDGQRFPGPMDEHMKLNVNGDGRDDLYLCHQGGLPNRLLIHTADGTLRDASRESGLDFLESTRSALFLDLDNDGDQDFVASLGANLLVAYNGGRGQFGQFTPLNGIGFEDVYSLSAADADRDGDLDLYAVRYVANGIMGGVPTPYHNANNGASNLYWRNDGVGKWTLATEEVGLNGNNRKFSLASIWEDFDDDGDLDDDGLDQL